MRALKIICKIILHIAIILFVTFGPPIWYDVLINKARHLVWYSYIAGILGYTLYIFYWLLKIKHVRVKIILMYFAAWIDSLAILYFFTNNKTELFIFVPPVLVLLFALAHSFAPSDIYKAKSARHAFYLLLPLTAVYGWFAFFALGMASVGNMRY
jgi:hypothetical protein